MKSRRSSETGSMLALAVHEDQAAIGLERAARDVGEGTGAGDAEVGAARGIGPQALEHGHRGSRHLEPPEVEGRRQQGVAAHVEQMPARRVARVEPAPDSRCVFPVANVTTPIGASSNDVPPAIPTVKSAAWPPGRTCGQRWVRCPVEVSGVVSGTGVPPFADTRARPVKLPGVKTIVSSRPKLPPRPSGASHSVSGRTAADRHLLELPGGGEADPGAVRGEEGRVRALGAGQRRRFQLVEGTHEELPGAGRAAEVDETLAVRREGQGRAPAEKQGLALGKRSDESHHGAHRLGAGAAEPVGAEAHCRARGAPPAPPPRAIAVRAPEHRASPIPPGARPRR